MIEKIRSHKKMVVLFLVLFLAVGLGAYGYERHRAAQVAARELVLQGNVDLREVSLAFRNSDRIADVFVEEGDAVKQGQVLAKLETQDLTYQLAMTRAQVEAQRAAVEKLHNGTRTEDLQSAKARLQAAQAEKEFLEADEKRKQAAHESSGGKSVSRQMLEEGRSKRQVAEEKWKEAQEAWHLAVAGPRQEDVAAGEARLAELEQALKRQEYMLSQSELMAPQDGIIRSRLLEVGDMASPQKPVFRLSLLSKKWVRVYVNEKDLGRIQEGMAAKVSIDSDPDHPISGQVGYIASTAEFTPKNVETTDLRTSLLYEVRVYVTDEGNKLRMGMPATVKLEF